MSKTWWMYPRNVCAGSGLQTPEPGRFAVYLREAQAYMLISMPTCTSTIFGVFQVIGGLPLLLARCSRPH